MKFLYYNKGEIKMSERELKVREIVLEMFHQRNYTDVDEENAGIILALQPDGEKVCAFINIINKLNVAEINAIVGNLQQAKISHGIVVYEGTPTSAVKNVVANTPSIDLNIELFHADDLQFNITKHSLVPAHSCLDKNDAKEFKAKYGTSIPTLFRLDPVARFYDFHKGDIIKIARKTGHITYRLVK